MSEARCASDYRAEFFSKRALWAGLYSLAHRAAPGDPACGIGVSAIRSRSLAQNPAYRTLILTNRLTMFTIRSLLSLR